MAKRGSKKRSKARKKGRSPYWIAFLAIAALVVIAALLPDKPESATTATPDVTRTAQAKERQVAQAATADAESTLIAQTPRTDTPTFTPSATITDTPIPTITPIPTVAPETFYTIRAANARECERTTCPLVTTLPAGTAVSVVGYVQGEAVSGSTLWRQIVYDGREIYIHDSLLSKNAPQPTAAPVQVQPVVQPTNPPLSQPGTTWNCSGDLYNCDSFQTCNAMRDYWNTCPGDPSKLDGNNDGRPCESRCG